AYADLEARAESVEGWRPYREVLEEVLRGLCNARGVSLGEDEAGSLAKSLPGWPLFDDTREALERLGSAFGLAIVSNVDDDLFAGTRQVLGVEFDEVVTAEQARAYKPSLRPFELLFERLPCERKEILHLAQSLYHDHEPARHLGLPSIRVDRPSRLPGRGVAPDTDLRPQREVPDLASVADFLGA
ncbi:MAG: HAD hydrolase-like protein, partial [Gemmatimonadetes bacterium]|nr:HAD hydrolase-like protein [Gemmatimonadota bacterium]NIR81583.1 HAD hydrolase-like protein [Gemmatimonadota bacterium]NIT90424.1 HAD hydrolase-like protein [Gemmatimonadota bacterium]NIU34226.1 HAD hydrolase-like protein [Gemmatimonadota bacterium]NIV64575.1 HAD hydrolase-like protein [Gemmatimonadota bacterium]